MTEAGRRRRSTTGKISPITLILGLLMVGIFIYAFFSREVVYADKLKMLSIISALVAALFAYTMAGDVVLKLNGLKSPLGEVNAATTGAMAVFILVLLWWRISGPATEAIRIDNGPSTAPGIDKSSGARITTQPKQTPAADQNTARAPERRIDQQRKIRVSTQKTAKSLHPSRKAPVKHLHKQRKQAPTKHPAAIPDWMQMGPG